MKYTEIDWKEFWKWREEQPLTKSDLKKRDHEYWKNVQFTPITLKRLEALYGSW